MKKLTQKFYAWIGQNASTGTPHPITGNMSMYGDDYVFSSKTDRDRFVEDYTPDNPSEYCVACSKRELRAKNLGCSVADWEQNLEYRETVEASP